MLFTHFGVSGPIVLMLSDKASLWLSQGHEIKASIDLKPALTEDVLDKRVLRDLETYHLKQMAGALQDLMPHRMIDVILSLAGIERDLTVSDLKKAQRIALVKTMKAMPLTVTGTRPISEAIVTAGGVSVKEINPSTMESKVVKKLYMAGEVLDVHAFTGGYNLQAAFSTGHLAALSAVRSLEMRKLSIAIDGPAGAGKSSVSKILAARLGYAYLDTGAMYRAVTYEVLSKGIFDEIEIVLMINKIDMEVKPDKDAMLVFVDGEDVTPFLRTADVSAHVSWVSAMAGVRRAMVKIQRKQAEKGGIVLDGRDIGTTVLPNADVKIFLTASAHTRAIRRCMELAAAGQDVTPEGIEEDIEKRDYQDSHRAVSPLRQADDAVLLDNGDLTLEETADAIISICREKFPGFDA